MQVKLPTYTPSNLLKPLPTTQQKDRKAWSIGINSTWLPFFMAMNVTGQANIAPEVLGAPLRLAIEKDGKPRFNKAGMPVLRVVKELNDQIRITRENFALHLQKTAEAVQSAMPKQYAAEVERCQASGKSLIEKDSQTVQSYLNELEAIAAAAASKNGSGDIETVPAGDKGEPVLVG